MSRQSWLVALVAVLTITCLGLIIGLATLDDGEPLQQPQKIEAPEPEPEVEPEPEPVYTKPWEKDVRLPSHLLPLCSVATHSQPVLVRAASLFTCD